MRRRRAIAASAVCASHVLVLLAAWQVRQSAPRDDAGAREPISIRLIPERREHAARAQAAAAPAVTPPRRPVVEPARPAEPTAVSSVLVPVPAAAASAGVADAAGMGSVASAASGSAGQAASLSLKPSREVLLGSLGSNEAVHDPRSNTPKPTFEERIAMGLNPELCVKVERLPDGTIKRSMGKWRGVPSTAQATGVTSGGGSGSGAGTGGGGGLSFGGGGGGIRLCT
ncbi:hypothetical protein ACG04R_06430 [Roseateles sp. BYS78W]|uniref:Uncharacterized protein n=1 Tax=Pelomonas candidula TaxID=3299025 RepID=A0ABW7H8R5_9BURK